MALTDAQKAQLNKILDDFMVASDDPEFQSQYNVAVSNVMVQAARDIAVLEKAIYEDGISSIKDVKKQGAEIESEGKRQGALASIRKKLFG